MSLPQEAIEEFKEIYKKEYKKELSDAEARESAENLVRFFDLLWECEKKDIQRKQLLKKEPEGFHLTDEVYNCLICHCTVTGDESWYDKWGVKCLLCQKAIKEETVPGFVCKERESWYAVWQLKDKFGIHPQTARKMVRIGELKARIVATESGQPYEYVFLKKENPHLISRYSPERKSYDRHRDKENARRFREWKIEWKKKNKIKI